MEASSLGSVQDDEDTSLLSQGAALKEARQSFAPRKISSYGLLYKMRQTLSENSRLAPGHLRAESAWYSHHSAGSKMMRTCPC